jgi:hypothetical protein
VTNRGTGTTTRATQGSRGGGAITRNQAGLGGVSGVGRTGAGDVYAGRDGNVYRNQGGSWQKYENGNWSSVNRPGAQSKGTTGRVGNEQVARGSQINPATRDQLNSDRSSRGDGARRTQDLGRVNSGWSRGAGSYRPSGGFSGGGMRGGGMRGGRR